MTKAWESVKKAAKDHHEGLNAAYATYYGQGSSTAPSRSHSTVSSEAVANDSEAKKAGVWEKVVKKAKVHHQSVNSAYAAVYGHI
jgi:hypothetical protein